MMEKFSPIDSVEFLSNPAQPDSTTGGTKKWIWVLLIGITFVIGVCLMISQQTQRKKLKDANA